MKMENMKMKRLFLGPATLALLLAIAPMVPAFTAIALADSAQRSPGEGKLAKLNLTSDQKAEIKKIGESTRQQIEAVLTPEQKTQLQTARQQKQKPNLTLSDDQKAKITAIREGANTRISAVLTPAQRQQLQEIGSNRQQKPDK